MLGSKAYLDHRILEISNQLKKQTEDGEPQDDALKKLLKLCERVKAKVEQGLHDQSITSEQYLATLRGIEAKDILICKHFYPLREQPGVMSKLKIILARKRIIDKEIQDMGSAVNQ